LKTGCLAEEQGSMTDMRSLKCLGCRQVFDDKKLLFGHLQKNESHKRGKKVPKKKFPKSQTPQTPQTQSNVRSNSHVLVTPKRAETQIGATSLGPGSSIGLSWFCITEEQGSYLHQAIPDKCHPHETLQGSQYRLENKTRAQLEQLQKCSNCNSMFQDQSK